MMNTRIHADRLTETDKLKCLYGKDGYGETLLYIGHPVITKYDLLHIQTHNQ